MGDRTANIASQVTCMFLLLLGTFVCGVLPVFVKAKLFQCDCTGGSCRPSCRARKGKLVTSFLIYFGGGVLLGTCILHLLPESREGFEEAHEEAHDNTTLAESEGGHSHEHFPIPEFVVCCGFFAVYLFEEIIHFFLGGHSHVPSENRAIRSFSRSNSCSSTGPSDVGLSGKLQQPTNPTVVVEDSSKAKDTFSIAGLLTVAALSFHSLFEGFAVGLQPNATNTWIVFAAIAVHKYVIAFVVGLEVLAGGGRNLQVYIYMTIFAVMSPLGMAIAMITNNSLSEHNPFVSVLNAIATGTLLYITFFEILQRNEERDISTWIQLIATGIGFALMCVIQYVSTFA